MTSVLILPYNLKEDIEKYFHTAYLQTHNVELVSRRFVVCVLPSRIEELEPEKEGSFVTGFEVTVGVARITSEFLSVYKREDGLKGRQTQKPERGSS